ncbi:autism susceptibility gene 2 protein-like isoform X2 [Liolophura sinensis]|uniref:autism susceptibility gene 2 protein-like isoform X2 n=1 Tax=Liolophura sinensis TaxID=3198878 RepID=UPI0031583BCF
MESEEKLHRIRRARRRERAQQLQEKPCVKDEMEDSPPRTSKDKGRPKPRRRRNSSNSHEEDIIDGFAIISFKSLVELENSIKPKNNVNNLPKKGSTLQNDVNCKSSEQPNKARNSTLSKEKQKQNKKKGKKNSNQTLNNKIPRELNCSSQSEGTPQTNGPSRSTSRDRLSDGSTHSSIGYLCDSERSEDDRASDAGSELFSLVSHTRESIHPPRPSVTPPVNHILPVSSPAPTTIPTTTTTTTSAPSATATTVTTATTTATTATGTATTPCAFPVPHSPSVPVTRPCKPPSPTTPCISPAVTSALTTTQATQPPVCIPPPKKSLQSPCSLPPPAPLREPPKVAPIPSRPFHRDELHNHKDPLDFVKNSTWNSSAPPGHHNSLPPHTHTSVHTPHQKHPSPSLHTPTQRHTSPSLHSSPISQRHTSPSLHNSTSRHTSPSIHNPSQRHTSPSLHISTSLHNSSTSLHNSSTSLHNSVPHRSPGLSAHAPLPLHSPHRSHHSTPFPPAGPHPQPQPLHAHPHPPGHHPSQHSMFAAPLPPPPAPLTSSALPVHGSVTNPLLPTEAMPFHTSQELQQELNRRFLESHTSVDRNPSSAAAPSPRVGPIPYLRQDIHQHQHMHQHQHTHQHTYGPLPPPPHQYPASLVPTPSPHVYEKMPKFDPPFYRQNIPGIPSYPAVPSLLHTSGPGPLNSSMHGAFQPKKVTTGMHPSQVMLSMRDREKNASSSSLPAAKKSGKWCAMHVRVAWEIYHHQQKQQAEAQKGDSKQTDPLRPSGHLIGGLHRPPDLTSATLLGAAAHSRSPFDGSFLNPAHLGVSPFSRPFPGLGGGIGFGPVGNGFFNGDRQLSGIHVPGVTPPQEWNRLHRTPPSFPTPPAWPKPDAEREREREREREKEKEREREREREKERERERDRERERERQKEREREISANDKLRLGDRERDRLVRSSPHHDRHPLEMLDKSRERDIRPEKFHTGDRQHSRSRSRSRSPLRNGRPEPPSRLDPLYLDKSVKIKEEHSAEEDLSQRHLINLHLERERERDKIIHNDYIMRGFASPHPGMGPVGLNLMERSRMLAPAYSMPADRVHPGVWSPLLDKGLDLNQRLELQREMERERERMLSRLNPLGVAMLEDQRMKEQEMFFRERAMEARFLERFQPFDRERMERMEMDRSKIPPLRGPDPLVAVHQGHRPTETLNHTPYHRPISPFLNHHSSSKNGSPASLPPGAPPPLIPSLGSATQSRSHTNSPLNKAKNCSPTDSNSESKDRRETSSTDPELHSR